MAIKENFAIFIQEEKLPLCEPFLPSFSCPRPFHFFFTIAFTIFSSLSTATSSISLSASLLIIIAFPAVLVRPPAKTPSQLQHQPSISPIQQSMALIGHPQHLLHLDNHLYHWLDRKASSSLFYASIPFPLLPSASPDIINVNHLVSTCNPTLLSSITGKSSQLHRHYSVACWNREVVEVTGCGCCSETQSSPTATLAFLSKSTAADADSLFSRSTLADVWCLVQVGKVAEPSESHNLL